jgi:hypothetical protein
VAAGLLSGVGAVSNRVGRYFTVVSALPSAALVTYVYVLVRTGAWSGSVNWAAAVQQFHLADLALLTVVSFVAALALHPLQFAMLQVLEGYWGTTAPWRWFAVLRIMYHRHRCEFLDETGTRARMAIRDGQVDMTADIASALEAELLSAESQRLRASYPEDIDQILPTRLGNVLRRYEMSAGSPYGLNVIPALPRLAMVARPAEVEYLQNQRIQMELAARTSLLAMVAAVLTAVFMWRHPAWMLIAVVPYVIGYAAYRGAVTVAHEYGTAMAVLAELNRFSLYDRLQLPRPVNIDAELDLNARLMNAFGYRSDVWFDYVAEPTGETESAQSDRSAGRSAHAAADTDESSGA